MKFTVTLCDSDNVCVKKFIDCVKKTKPDCTIVQGDMEVKAHKMLLHVFSDTKFFNERKTTVVVLFNQSQDAIKKVITELLYDAKVVVNEGDCEAIQSLCKNLGIKIETSVSPDPFDQVMQRPVTHLGTAVLSSPVPSQQRPNTMPQTSVTADSDADPTQSPAEEVAKKRCLSRPKNVTFQPSPAGKRITRSSTKASSEATRERDTPGSSGIQLKKRRNTLASTSLIADNSDAQATPIQPTAEKAAKKRRVSRTKSVYMEVPASAAENSCESLRASSPMRIPILPARASEILKGHGKLTLNERR